MFKNYKSEETSQDVQEIKKLHSGLNEKIEEICNKWGIDNVFNILLHDRTLNESDICHQIDNEIHHIDENIKMIKRQQQEIYTEGNLPYAKSARYKLIKNAKVSNSNLYIALNEKKCAKSLLQKEIECHNEVKNLITDFKEKLQNNAQDKTMLIYGYNRENSKTNIPNDIIREQSKFLSNFYPKLNEFHQNNSNKKNAQNNSNEESNCCTCTIL